MEAGVAVLAEGGWPAVTTRAVADRAGAHLGLIHYHFGGLPGLRRAIALHAGELVIGPVVRELSAADDARSAIDRLRRILPETTGDVRVIRLATELMTGALGDPALGDLMRVQLREARERIAERLERLRPHWSRPRRIGVATVAAALVDGLMLHRLVDPALPTEEALTALSDLLGVEP